MNKKNKKNQALVKNSKLELQNKILDLSKENVLLLDESHLKSLGIVFGKKDSVIVIIEDVVFVTYQVLDGNNKKQYLLQRRIDKATKAHDAAFITDIQAKKIGLNESLTSVRIGDDVYNLYYINADSLPKQSQDFVYRTKTTKVDDEKFVNNLATVDSANNVLENFFEDLRKWDKFQEDKHAVLDDISSFVLKEKAPEKLVIEKEVIDNVVDITSIAPTTTKPKVVGVLQSNEFDINKIAKTNYHYLEDKDAWHLSTYYKNIEIINFEYNNSFKSVNSFWNKLVQHYSVPANILERRFFVEKSLEKLPVFNKEQEELITLLSKTKEAHREQALYRDLARSKEKHAIAIEKATKLRDILTRNNVDVSKSQELRKLNNEIKFLDEKIKDVEQALNNFYENKKILVEKYGKNLIPQQYTNVHGDLDLLNRYNDYIQGVKTTFDDELNAIEFQKQEFERVLLSKLSKIHDAKKHLTTERLLKQNQLVVKDENKEELRRKELQELAEKGMIADNSSRVQEAIELEQARLSNSLEILKEFEDIDDYAEALTTVREKEKELLGRKIELDRDINAARFALAQKQKEISQEHKNIARFIANFELDISLSIKEVNQNNKLLVEHLWQVWNKSAIGSINEIFTKKIELLSQVSDVVSSQIDRLSVEQMKSLEQAQARQLEWDRVYGEVVNEYKKLNYYIEEPAIAPFNISDFDTEEFVNIELSHAIEKVINFTPTLDVSDQPIQDQVIGLEPKIFDDSHFMALDQIGDSLTPKQQEEYERRLQKMQEKQALAESEEQKRKEQEAILEAEMQAKVIEANEENERIDALIRKDQELANEKLKEEESESLRIAQLRLQISSSAIGQFKEDIFAQAKNLIKTKQVEMINTNLVISDLGLVKNKNTAVYSNKDYHLVPKGISFNDDLAINQSAEIKDDSRLITNLLETKKLDGDNGDNMPSTDNDSNVLPTNDSDIPNADDGFESGSEPFFDPQSPSLNEGDEKIEDLNDHEGMNQSFYHDQPEEDQDSAKELDQYQIVDQDQIVVDENEEQMAQVSANDVVTEKISPKETFDDHEQLVDDTLTTDHNKTLYPETNEAKIKNDIIEMSDEEMKNRYEILNLDLTELRNRIEALDQEIARLNQYANNQEEKVAKAIEVREELRRQFNEHIANSKLEYDQTQTEIDSILKLEARDTSEGKDVTINRFSQSDALYDDEANNSVSYSGQNGHFDSRLEEDSTNYLKNEDIEFDATTENSDMPMDQIGVEESNGPENDENDDEEEQVPKKTSFWSRWKK